MLRWMRILSTSYSPSYLVLRPGLCLRLCLRRSMYHSFLLPFPPFVSYPPSFVCLSPPAATSYGFFAPSSLRTNLHGVIFFRSIDTVVRSIRVRRINSCEDKYFNRPMTSHPLRPFAYRRKTIPTSDFRSQFSLPFRSFQPCCPSSSLLHIPRAYFVPVHVCTRMFTFSFLLFYLFFRLFPFFCAFSIP